MVLTQSRQAFGGRSCGQHLDFRIRKRLSDEMENCTIVIYNEECRHWFPLQESLAPALVSERDGHSRFGARVEVPVRRATPRAGHHQKLLLQALMGQATVETH
jgi:hypothetical protein